jgi:hypothetical protein
MRRIQIALSFSTTLQYADMKYVGAGRRKIFVYWCKMRRIQIALSFSTILQYAFKEVVILALSPGVKRPGHEADHSLPTSVEVKKTWVYTSTLQSRYLSIRHKLVPGEYEK